MREKENYRYLNENGLVDVFTLSPSKKYYYKIKDIKELNKSAFGCKISFFLAENNKLVYYRKGVFSHEIHSKEEIDRERNNMRTEGFQPQVKKATLNFVIWSLNGELAYFIEYRNHNEIKTLESVILSPGEEYCYRINELVNNFAIVDQLNLTKPCFNEDIVLTQIHLLNIKKEPVKKDSISIIDSLFGKS